MTTENILVEVRNLSVEFKVSARDWFKTSRKLRAVDKVSFCIARGETLALVGESGCGKTTIGRTLLCVYEPTEGEILFEGVNVFDLKDKELHKFRRRAQMIFQDPYASLNPRMKIQGIIEEPLRAHSIGRSVERGERVRDLLEKVGLPKEAAGRFPNAFSGGQRQRVGIARAIALDPEFIILDEPVSSLDVSVQAQIVNLLKDLQTELGLAMLFIAHDLAVVRQIATRIAVMYLGKIVELGTRDSVLENPRHPYTQSLLSAVPIPDPSVERTRKRTLLSGDLPSPISPPSGCRFRTRCPSAFELCASLEPELQSTGDGRVVACHLVFPPLKD